MAASVPHVGVDDVVDGRMHSDLERGSTPPPFPTTEEYRRTLRRHDRRRVRRIDVDDALMSGRRLCWESCETRSSVDGDGVAGVKMLRRFFGLIGLTGDETAGDDGGNAWCSLVSCTSSNVGGGAADIELEPEDSGTNCIFRSFLTVQYLPKMDRFGEDGQAEAAEDEALDMMLEPADDVEETDSSDMVLTRAGRVPAGW